MKPETLEAAREQLEVLSEKLWKAQEAAMKLVAILGNDAELTGPRIESYLVNSLEGFIESKYQPGGIIDIQNSLDKLEKMAEEEN